MSGSAKKKQGTLFSFFSKPKKATASPASSSAAKAKVASAQSTLKATSPSLKSTDVSSKSTSRSSSSSKSLSSQPTKQEKLLASVQVGCSISVFWPADEEYYTAKVTAKKRQPSGSSNVVTLLYEDGEVETIDLTNEKFKILSQGAKPKESEAESLSETENVVSKSSKKRKVIQESDEEEFEFEDDIEEDDASEDEFVADEESEDEEEFEAMDVTDEDEEIVNKRKRSSKPAASQAKRAKVTDLKSPKAVTSQSKAVAPFITPPSKMKSTTAKNAFASFASGKKAEEKAAAITQSPTQPNLSSTKKSPSSKPFVPFPQSGVVNQAGTHYHNHFKFLQPEHIRDSRNRPSSHPDYDQRTLKVDFNEMERTMNSKITPAQRQWWEIKSQYFDTILLFKTGKFYEIFHVSIIL